jgi:cyclophilin family peptidyl-prolyl cis-trans isomerase
MLKQFHFNLISILNRYSRVVRPTTLSIFVAFSLIACGGSTGFEPVVTGVKAQSLMYGHTASILLGGKDLRSTITVDTQGACTSPSFSASSTTELLVLNCRALTVGDFLLSVKSAQGDLLFTEKLTIPKPQVMLLTSKGNITLELEPSIAPVSVNNFLTYVSQGYYKGTIFHRVIPGFVVQAGGYSSGMVKKSGQAAPISLESNKGLSNVRGSLAMARTNIPNSATSEFYVNLVNNTSLDYKNSANPGYAVFGTVVQGMDTVDAIALEPTSVYGAFADVPLSEVAITLAIQVK